MRIHNLSKPGYRFLFMLAEFVILLACIIWTDSIYILQILPDKLATQNFVKTDCLIMSKKLSSQGEIFNSFRADFLINYQAKGAQYTRWVSGNGLDMSYYRDNERQEKMLSNFKDGSNYPCWYHPDNPELAMLAPRDPWTYLSAALIPLCIGLLALLLFVKNVVIILMLKKRSRLKI